MSMKKSLPYNQIIQEYLNIEFDKTNETNTREIQNIKSKLNVIENTVHVSLHKVFAVKRFQGPHSTRR